MKTFLTFSGGRVEMRTKLAFRCADCGARYHARVHSHPERVLALALLAVLGFAVVVGLGFTGRVERSWILWAKVGAAVIVALIAVQASRLQKRMMEPTFYTRDLAREPEFGEIVLECPRCGSARVDLGRLEPGPQAPPALGPGA